jgi:hypothetical protein
MYAVPICEVRGLALKLKVGIDKIYEAQDDLSCSDIAIRFRIEKSPFTRTGRMIAERERGVGLVRGETDSFIASFFLLQEVHGTGKWRVFPEDWDSTLPPRTGRDRVKTPGSAGWTGGDS